MGFKSWLFGDPEPERKTYTAEEAEELRNRWGASIRGALDQADMEGRGDPSDPRDDDGNRTSFGW
jgi:hypothetical protein